MTVLNVLIPQAPAEHQPRGARSLGWAVGLCLWLTSLLWAQPVPVEGFPPPIEGLAVDPQNSLVMYAVADIDWSYQTPIFRSTDGGRSWAPLALMPEGQLYDSAFTVLVHPENDRVLYVGTLGGIHRTEDGGITWTRISEAMAHQRTYTLAMHPNNPDMLFAGSGGELYRTENGGDDWTYISGPRDISAIVFDPTRPEILYVADFDSGIYKSTNGGRNFTKLDYSTTKHTQCILVDPRDPDIVYAGSPHGLRRSIDGGATWARYDTNLDNDLFLSLQMDPISLRMWAGKRSGLYVSEDEGRTWRNLTADQPCPFVSSVVWHPDRPDELVYGAACGLYHSADGGATWAATHASLPGILHPFTVQVTGEEPGAYLVGGRSGLYRKTPTGGFVPINTGMAHPQINALARHPHSPQILYAAAGSEWDEKHGEGGSLAKSIDGGATWTEIDAGLEPWYRLPSTPVRDVAVHPTEPETVYAATRSRGLYRSDDGGQTWQHLPAFPLDVTHLAIDPFAPETLYVVTYLGFYQSDDGGATARLLPQVRPNGGRVLVHPQSGVVYVLGKQVFVWARDGLWRPLTPGTDLSTKALLFHPEDSNHLVLSRGDQIHRSLDGGDTWQFVTWSARSFQMDWHPGQSHTLLLATDRGLRVLEGCAGGYAAWPDQDVRSVIGWINDRRCVPEPRAYSAPSSM